MVTYGQVEFIYGVLLGLYRASRPLQKGRSGVSPSRDFEIMASRDSGVVYFTEYLSELFQLTYLNELYGECNGTARACVNSGYQTIFSPITEHLGMRLVMRLYAVHPPWESLASAPPQPNVPVEDESHNLRIDIVDPIHSPIKSCSKDRNWKQEIMHCNRM